MGLALVGTALVTVTIFIWFILTRRQMEMLKNVKKKEERERRLSLSKNLRMLKWALVISSVVFGATGTAFVRGGGEKAIILDHTHGIGFSTDGKRIIIPAHEGLKAYEAGRWSALDGDRHDYMGFSSVNDGFYSSGHPAPGSDLQNPFGVVKSTDEGKSLRSLALVGETDFHNMAVGYVSHAIFAVNPQPNTQMNSTGLFYSTDDAKTWTKSEMKGVNEEVTAISVHPTETSIVALGTPTGVYLSEDYGNNFEKVSGEGQTTSLFFNLEGKLYMGGFQNRAYLQKMDIESKNIETVVIPSLPEDAISYFTQNAKDERQMAFTTYKNNIYFSQNKGFSWTKIADEGKTISLEKETVNE